MKRELVVMLVGAVAGAIVLVGHRWVMLGWNAWHYPTAAPGAHTQAVLTDAYAFVAAGESGMDVLAIGATQASVRIAPKPPLDRIDDLAIADGWLFALDATPPGYLQVYSLAIPRRPAPVGDAVAVPVGPFSGVSAAAGLVAVSGGTSSLTLRRYDASGHLDPNAATADLGRGQPDVLLRGDGKFAVVSTHAFGPDFGLGLVALTRSPVALRKVAFVPIGGAGFTRGGYKPAHFPLVTAWQADRIYVANGGGLTVVDASSPTHPRRIGSDPGSQPAIDVAICGSFVEVLRAGEQPAVVHYRPAKDGMPTLAGVTVLPRDAEPGALACAGDDRLVTLRGRGWQWLPAAPRTTTSR